MNTLVMSWNGVILRLRLHPTVFNFASSFMASSLCFAVIGLWFSFAPMVRTSRLKFVS